MFVTGKLIILLVWFTNCLAMSLVVLDTYVNPAECHCYLYFVYEEIDSAYVRGSQDLSLQFSQATLFFLVCS